MKLPCVYADEDCDGGRPPLCAGCQADLEDRRRVWDEFENQLAVSLALWEQEAWMEPQWRSLMRYHQDGRTDWKTMIKETLAMRHPKAPFWALVVEAAGIRECAGVLDTDDDLATAEKLDAWVAAGRPGLETA